jgi:hypothetical protein
LKRLRRTIEELRNAGGVKPKELERLARAVGREPRAGSHQTWVYKDNSTAPPLPIPHPSKDINRFTAQAILDVLDDDLDRIEKTMTPTNPNPEDNGHGQPADS